MYVHISYYCTSADTAKDVEMPGQTARTLLQHSLNGRERGPNFDNARHRTKWEKNRKHGRCLSETSQATLEATASTATANTATATATTAQAGAAALMKPEEALTQDQPDDEELLPGDDQPEEGRVAAGAEDTSEIHCIEDPPILRRS
ncbi:hypothetical protein MAR_021715 [Mya arenaria]|uniref:Uncharacterized protein n=1 Tax=Mya arenaria TaxID=6604 RepID=A0ABY7ECD1_MYAAR|nr:hypothetical protein MAR_021715 [Mya arenaria]